LQDFPIIRWRKQCANDTTNFPIASSPYIADMRSYNEIFFIHDKNFYLLHR